MRLFILLSILLTIVSASDEYKIIIGTYGSQSKANNGLENIKNALASEEKYIQLQEKYNLQLIARHSGNSFITILEPFPGFKASNSLLNIIKRTNPSAFVNKISSEKLEDNYNVGKKETVKKMREQVNVNFSNLEIEDFIKLISKVTHKNILINNSIKGTVNFISTTPVYDDELLGILVSVLESKGFTLIRDGSIYKVIRSTEVAKHNAQVKKTGQKAYGSLMVTQVIKVEGENVDVVAAKVRYLISKTAKLMTMKESNTLLITDYPKNIETIKQVMKDIVRNNKSIVKVIHIEHTDAKKLHTKLVDIGKSLFNDKIINEQVKIILDDSINGLIIVGLAKNVLKVEELVKKLDIKATNNEQIRVYKLKNSDAKGVLTTLNEIISKQKFADPSKKPNVTFSDEINAIVIVGSPMIIKGIVQIIEELDKEKYQVYVTARIINIYKKNTEDLGIKYGFDGAAVSSSGGLYQLSTNMGGTSVNTSFLTAAGITLPSALTTGFGLHAAIDFLEKNDASKSISNPSILCVNNKESSIYVGQTISISSGSVSTGGLTGVTNSFKREDVGLTLKIKPRVSSKDKVTLEVEAILESVDSFGDAATGEQPVTSKQEVKTQVILRHAESVIIGGLVKNVDVENESKVPLLGDIPYLGALFKSSSTDEEETNLVVVLTPYVIDKSENLSELQKQLGYVAKLQKEYNVEVFKNLKEKSNPIELEEVEIDDLDE
ncbi:MAG: general secretion pathway protein D [Sulfurimonas sp.]|jgi:general secretion pathway protein D|uniref:type II secretion system secretin GspD n=1 Tax=Sulfurimonas sp. TaxID=2022749 RepID=UPI0039E6D33B